MSTNNWKYKIDYGICDLYKFYKNSFVKKDNGITESQYKEVIKHFNEAISNTIVEKSYEYRLPYRLGYLRIKKHKTRLILDADGKLKTSHLKPNWKKTKELWKNNKEAEKNKKIIYHTNKHSQGFYYKWYWDKTVCNIKNSSVYSLIVSRTNTRKIAQAIKNNKNLDYYE
jgi:hypothetical protein